ncbi:MAG: hypothetical protein AB1Z67_11760 [Candidatus Limnocylindrales bacterium]
MKYAPETLSEPSVRGSAGELIGSGAERAKDVLDLLAERTQDAIDTADIDPGAIRAGAARALMGASGREAQCEPAIEAAGDRLRLKTAIVTSVVAFALSALVFLAAREIARRGRERSLEGHPSEQPTPLRPGEALEG